MKISDFVVMTQVDDAGELAGALFERKYRLPVPKFPYHVLARVRQAEDSLVTGCYMHFTDCGDILLGGGACTDDRVLRRMSSEQRNLLRGAGGLYGYGLKWAIDRFRDRFPVLFACSGDRLSDRVMFACGFQATPVDKLRACWMQEVGEVRREQMLAKAASFIPF